MNWSKEWGFPIIDIDSTGKPQSIITIKNGNRLETIPVTIIGDLALYHDTDGWNIYHVPTLSLFSSAVPNKYMRQSENLNLASDYEYDKQPLLNWMKKVQENYPTTWQMLRCLTPDDYEDKGDSAKRIIKEWCLSVKVE